MNGYRQPPLENAEIYAINNDLVDQIFDFMVRDLSGFALKLYSQPTTTKDQMNFCQQMIERPDVNHARFQRVWLDQVFNLKNEC